MTVRTLLSLSLSRLLISLQINILKLFKGMNAQRNAANYQDVMIVGVNYRLGPWGFFYLNEKEADQDWQGKKCFFM